MGDGAAGEGDGPGEGPWDLKEKRVSGTHTVGGEGDGSGGAKDMSLGGDPGNYTCAVL